MNLFENINIASDALFLKGVMEQLITYYFIFNRREQELVLCTQFNIMRAYYVAYSYYKLFAKS